MFEMHRYDMSQRAGVFAKPPNRVHQVWRRVDNHGVLQRQHVRHPGTNSHNNCVTTRQNCQVQRRGMGRRNDVDVGTFEHCLFRTPSSVVTHNNKAYVTLKMSHGVFKGPWKTVSKYHGKLRRNGWYLQQLLKLYAGKIIPDILDKYLVIDSDTFFLKPTTFIENNKCLYNYGREYHKPYFEHMIKLDKGLNKIYGDKSGICHHMIFETKYIDELISRIEINHNDLFYNVFLKTVTDKTGSGASEYEIYFNYMLKYNPDKIKIRGLNWKNTNKLETNWNGDYISCHWWNAISGEIVWRRT
eukprot:g4222.t1